MNEELPALKRRLAAIEAEMKLRRHYYVGAEETDSYRRLAQDAAELRDEIEARERDHV